MCNCSKNNRRERTTEPPYGSNAAQGSSMPTPSAPIAGSEPQGATK